MKVLSLFDGMSCGQIALNRLGLKVDSYFASEVDKYAMQITKKNYPNTIHIGDVRNVDPGLLPKIDILIGGSPCQSFSFAGKNKGMATKNEIEILELEHYLELKKQGFEFEGQSYLFWEYMRILKAVKPKYFLLENVVMSSKWQNVLSKAIGIKPIKINSSLVSAQNRNRLYWTNIKAEPQGLFGDLECMIPQPKDKGIVLKDILQPNLSCCPIGIKVRKKSNCIRVGGKNSNFGSKQIWYSPFQRVTKKGKIKPGIEKSACLTGGGNSGGNHSDMDIINSEFTTRRYTPIECERLQTVPDNYTEGVSDTQRYKMLGNGWTVDVICHILSYIK